MREFIICIFLRGFIFFILGASEHGIHEVNLLHDCSSKSFSEAGVVLSIALEILIFFAAISFTPWFFLVPLY